MYYIGLDVHKRLCGAERSSGNTVQRTPLSKQRNKHLKTTLIEAA
jgi:transposase